MRQLGAGFAVSVLCTVLLLTVATPTAAQPEQVRILIRFNHQPGPAEEALVHAHGGHIRYTYQLVPAMAVMVPETALDGLQNNPNVTAVEPDGVVYAIDAELDNAWGVKRVGSGTVHSSGNLGTGVHVAIVDTGIDYTHPDLDGNYVGGYDFVNGDDYPMDDHGHGTHVAGTVAGEDNNIGVVGVAPQASLYALKVLNASGSGYWSDIVAAIDWAAMHDIQVTNNSYGGSADPGMTVREVFDISYSMGVLHVAAAGNSGSCSGAGDTVGYPAKFDSVMAVAATDSNDQRACFSSTGPAVEIAAPGVYINSAKLGGGYVQMSGTSMASPHVAGAAALVIASQINGPDLVRNQLVSTADDLGPAGPDPHYGAGLVNVAEAVVPGPVNQPPAVNIVNPTNGASFELGTSILFEGTAADPEDGDVTLNLVWTSNIDGQIGTGGAFATALSAGSHTITARAADSQSKTGSSFVHVTVTTPAATARIASVSYTGQGGKDGRKHIRITLVLQDDSNHPVEGAVVTSSITNQQTESSWQEVGTSGANGEVGIFVKNAASGCYSTSVVNVQANGLEWDGTTPPNNWCK